MRLASGRLTVRAPAEAAGFTVHTPASEVVDLGTEFAVVVERGGATELHVLEGEVAYSKPGTLPEMAELLGAGKAVRYDDAAEQAPHQVRAQCAALHGAAPPGEDRPARGFAAGLRRIQLSARFAAVVQGRRRDWLGRARGGSAREPSLRRTGEADLPIGFGKLNVTWPVQGGRGPMLEAPPDYVSRVRTLAQPMRLDEDGVYYVSVLVRWDPPPPAAQTKSARGPAGASRGQQFQRRPCHVQPADLATAAD